MSEANTAPNVGDVTGKKVGFRLDTLWRSWDWVAEEWESLLQGAGAQSVEWRAFSRTGADGERMDQERAEFIEQIDVAVVGLGNCGSCTQWTIKDALAAADSGVPTVAIVTEQFEDLAKTLATLGGHPDLQMLVLPYPFDTLPESVVRETAQERYRALLDTLQINLQPVDATR